MTAGMDCLHSSECMCLTELSVEKPFFQLCMHLIVKLVIVKNNPLLLS